MEAGKTKKRKKCSKLNRSSSSSSEYEVSRKEGHLKKSKISSKVDEFRAKKCSDVDGDIESKIERKRKSRKVKKRKSKSEESSSFSSSESEKQKKRKRKKKQKEKKKVKKHKKENAGRMNDLNSENQNNLREGTSKEAQEDMNNEPGPSVKPANSDEKPKRRAMAPMTKEEYDKQQSKVRRVFDPETGRERLVKGEGEIIEDIVSYERHREINKLSTAGDGAAFQKSLGLNRYDHDNKIYNRS